MTDVLVTIGAMMSIMAGAVAVTPKGGRAVWKVVIWALSKHFLCRHEFHRHRSDPNAHDDPES